MPVIRPFERIFRKGSFGQNLQQIIERFISYGFGYCNGYWNDDIKLLFAYFGRILMHICIDTIRSCFRRYFPLFSRLRLIEVFKSE